jgi:hypothetical protein
MTQFHPSRSDLHAAPGDRLVIKRRHTGDPELDGEILEVLGDAGTPPYVVRWDDGHESRVYPGADAHVQHFEHHAR